MRELLNLQNVDPRVHSYVTLRKTVGWLGILLPAMLLTYSAVHYCWDIEESMSAYYYTGMRDVFVGVLCAVGLFMFFYAGYSKLDDWTGNFASIFAILTALCPMEPPCGHMNWYNYIHFPAAAALFLTFAFFSLCLFTQTKANKIYKIHDEKEGWVWVGNPQIPWEKRFRNAIYRICGVGIILILILLAIWINLMKDKEDIFPVTYWGEFTMLILFGTSWLVKGEALWLKDREEFEDIELPLEDAVAKYQWAGPSCWLIKWWYKLIGKQ